MKQHKNNFTKDELDILRNIVSIYIQESPNQKEEDFLNGIIHKIKILRNEII